MEQAWGLARRGKLNAQRDGYITVMAQRLEEGRHVAFTIDGPRGTALRCQTWSGDPRAPHGEADLRLPFGLSRKHVFRKSWDLFQLPYPFSRAVTIVAPPIRVPSDADGWTA